MTNLTHTVFHRIHDVLKFTFQNKNVELKKKIITLKKYTQKNMLQNLKFASPCIIIRFK